MKTELEMYKNCETLGRIAEQYPEGSAELVTLQKAAIAFQLIHLNKLGPELEEMHDGIEIPLSDDQKGHLRSMGVNPDE